MFPVRCVWFRGIAIKNSKLAMYNPVFTKLNFLVSIDIQVSSQVCRQEKYVATINLSASGITFSF